MQLVVTTVWLPLFNAPVSNVSALGTTGSLGVYWYSNCSDVVSSIDWGELTPGSSKSVVVYVRNEMNDSVTLFLETQNWLPSNASDFLFLSWNYNGSLIGSYTVHEIVLSLFVSPDIEGITVFSFDIVVGWEKVLYHVVRGVDNRIYYNVWNSTHWAGWASLPGATRDSPAVAVFGNNLHVVVVGMDGGLWHGYVNLTDSTFSAWTLLSGATPSAPTLAASATKLYLVVRGNDDRICYRSWDGITWSGWASLLGATANRPAAAVLGGNLHIVVNGLDGNIYHGYVNLTTSTFSGWTPLSGSTPSPPELTASATKLYLAVRGNDNKIYYRSCDGSSWGGWTTLPGATTDGLAATVLDNNLHIVVRGTDGNIYYGYLDLTDGWSGWTKLSGATPSAPELAA